MGRFRPLGADFLARDYACHGVDNCAQVVPMDISISEELRMVRDLAREFTDQVIRPISAQIEQIGRAHV